MKTLTIAGCIFACLSLCFWPAPFTMLAMAMGIVLLAKGKWEHGLAVVIFAGTCGYYAMSSWMPLGGAVQAAPLKVMMIDNSTQQPVSPQDWRVLSLESRVINKDEGPVCEWKLVVRNESLQPAMFLGSLQFQDNRGTTLTEGRIAGYKVSAGAVATFEGSLPLEHGIRVSRVVPQIGVGG